VVAKTPGGHPLLPALRWRGYANTDMDGQRLAAELGRERGTHVVKIESRDDHDRRGGSRATAASALKLSPSLASIRCGNRPKGMPRSLEGAPSGSQIRRCKRRIRLTLASAPPSLAPRHPSLNRPTARGGRMRLRPVVLDSPRVVFSRLDQDTGGFSSTGRRREETAAQEGLLSGLTAD
jgi:hypothetical protein